MPAEGQRTSTQVEASDKSTPMPPESVRQPIVSLRQEVDRIFDGFLSHWPFDGRTWKPTAWSAFRTDYDALPAADVVEHDKEYVVTAELPGLDEKNIKVTLADDTLTIQGEKSEERKEDKDNYHLAERRYGSFRRSFRVPASVDPDKVDATYKKGVLTVVMPKTAEARIKQRTVKIKT